MVTVHLTEPGAPAQRPATFEAPEAMLLACHERVQRMCDLLQRLLEHAAQHGADAQARQAAIDVMRYFDLAGPQHHEDEERHVLPRLRASADAAQHEWADTLHAQHLRMAELWQQLRPALQALADGDAAPALARADVAQAFTALYAQHIPLEEQHAYPAALAGMEPEATAAMGTEMMRRRLPPAPAR